MPARLAEYLRSHSKVRGYPIAESGRKWGLERSVASRILNGVTTPSMETMLKIAVALEDHPAKLHELAGQDGIAELYRKLFPEMAAHPLHARLSGLLSEGLDEAVAKSLDAIEAAARKVGS